MNTARFSREERTKSPLSSSGGCQICQHASKRTVSSQQLTAETDHNAAKLDDPEFIKSVMKMSDDEIRSACMRRYRAAPEPAGNSMSM